MTVGVDVLFFAGTWYSVPDVITRLASIVECKCRTRFEAEGKHFLARESAVLLAHPKAAVVNFDVRRNGLPGDTGIVLQAPRAGLRVDGIGVVV
jgi:hypothetical protein